MAPHYMFYVALVLISLAHSGKDTIDANIGTWWLQQFVYIALIFYFHLRFMY